MELDKLKPGDRVIVRIPAASSSQAGSEVEATIVRIGLKKLAGVFRITKTGALRTLPMMNVLSMHTDQTPVEQKAKPGEDAIIATLPSYEEKLTAEVPAEKEKELPVGPGPEVKAPAPATPAPAANVTAAQEVMEQANEASTQAEQALSKLKPSTATKERKTLGAEERNKRREAITAMLLAGKKNKEISIEVGCDPAYVSDVKKKMLASGELAPEVKEPKKTAEKPEEPAAETPAPTPEAKPETN